jgi:hypothetical protein
MSTTSRRLSGALAVLSLAGLASASPALAGARQAASSPSHKVTAVELRVAQKTPILQIERIAQALPTPVATEQSAAAAAADGPHGTPVSVDGTPASPAAVAAASGLARPAATATAAAVTGQDGAWTGAYNANPNLQIGKLIFDDQPGAGVHWNWCTATAINTPNRSFVVTAGHCLYHPDPDNNGLVDGNGYWNESVQFCPGYEFGCKLGTWFARRLSTTNKWFYGGAGRAYDWSDDMGVVLVNPNSSGYLVNYVGGQGITFNQNVNLYRNAFGYPVTDSRWPQFTYSGQDLIYSKGYDTYYSNGTMTIPSTFVGGASGGPWLSWVASNWMGYVNSVNSHKPGTYVEGGPYFGAAEQQLYNDWASR